MKTLRISILFAVALVLTATVPVAQTATPAEGDDAAVVAPEDSRPCWRGKGQGSKCRGGGPDLSAVATATGTVLAYDSGRGRKMPTLTLDVGDDWLEVFVGPNRVWLDAGFEPVQGQELTVTYAPTRSESHLVALSVTDPATEQTVVLRDAETGRPTGGRGGCCRGHGGGRRGRR